MAIKHAFVTEKADNPEADVSADEWNAEHVIEGPLTLSAFPVDGMDAATKAYVDQIVSMNTRKTLLGTNNWYVNGTTGDDTNNDGLSAGTACKTINGALNKIGSVDISQASIIVNIADGTYGESLNTYQIYSSLPPLPLRGFVIYDGMYGTVTFKGNTTNPENVKITSGGGFNPGANRSAILLKGIGIIVSGTTYQPISVVGPMTVGVENCAFSGISLDDGARMLLMGTNKLKDGYGVAAIRGQSQLRLYYSVTLNMLSVYDASMNVTGGVFTIDDGSSCIIESGLAFTGSAPVGQRFRVRNNSTMVVPSGSLTAIAGTLPGQVDGGGTYGGIYEFDKFMVSGGATISESAPLWPSHGQFWWHSGNGNLYIRYDDGTTAQWVQINTVGN